MTAREGPPMATTEKPKTNQETWRDWLGPGEPEPGDLYSRDEIVKIANATRIRKPVKPGDLRLWEQLGILPRGIRRGHQGAARNVYPGWTANLAQQVRLLQDQGYSLEEIKPRVRTYARLTLGHGTTPTDEEIKARHRDAQAPEDVEPWPALVEELARLARWRASLSGVETARIEVRVIGADNRSTTYPIFLEPLESDA
jgi:DNA-binding transcriptional MerR regulator